MMSLSRSRLLATVSAGLLSSSVLAAPFSFVAIGDMPYKIPEAYVGFDALIKGINRVKPAFSVHIGDIKSGSSPCTDENFQKVLEMFGSFEQPLVYTPGDNEWTDCHHEKAGKFDPIERLAKIRSLFFAQSESLGKRRMPLKHQSDDPKYAAFVENTRWQRDGVVFATLHVVGSNNNLQRNAAAINEYLERNAANLAWLEAAFAEADKARALVLFMQADPWFDKDDAEDQRSGFSDTIRALRSKAAAFGKPVLIVHGDSHIFRVDQPLMANNGRPLDNVLRLEVFGEGNMHAVQVMVDPDDTLNPFSFKPMLIRENLNQSTAK
ncbi:hypothetical protein [Parachitinimonas caeni]|uniref:Calcineurin-like phosphoesterase domain-containing protein n=1 Tax=Parachitinimonas caeni TaxID=3031301 RepID=A0ABT7DUQ1_9NEIS|nr:hypothetical protein [Parachitinimonas caeni]MDK2123549.1 hypothetical protein [Parachitinimonas caeni]